MISELEKYKLIEKLTNQLAICDDEIIALDTEKKEIAVLLQALGDYRVVNIN